MEVPGFVTASPQDGISGISIVPFPELLSMFDAVEDGCDVFSFDSMFYRFLMVSHQSRKISRAFHAPKTAKIPLLQGCLFSWASAFPSLGLEDSEKYGAPFST